MFHFSAGFTFIIISIIDPILNRLRRSLEAYAALQTILFSYEES